MNFFETLRQHRRLTDLLRAQPKPALSPERRARMRREVIVAATAMPQSTTTPDIQAQPSRRLALATVLAALVLFLGASTAISAQAAGPGDRLFGLDRALERIHLALSFNANAKANAAANIAEERLSELEKIETHTTVNAQAQSQAETNADEALDRAIEAVGKVKTQSEKNREKIQSKAALKVQHLIELRDKHRAKKAEQEEKKNTQPAGAEDSTSHPSDNSSNPTNRESKPNNNDVNIQSTGGTKLESRVLVPQAAQLRRSPVSVVHKPSTSNRPVGVVSTASLNFAIGLRAATP